MSDRHSKQASDGQLDVNFTIEGLRGIFGVLPEAINGSTLSLFNAILADFFEVLRSAEAMRVSGQDRAAAITALRAAWTLIGRFETGIGQNLFGSFLNIASALEALDHHKVEPLFQPTPAPLGGRAPDSVARQALTGVAAAAVQRLQWVGLSRKAAHETVAGHLHRLGVRPSRGSGRITARTVREWCERVAEDTTGLSTATMNSRQLLTSGFNAQITALPPQQAREFVLVSLTRCVIDLGMGRKKPPNPPA